VLSSAQAGDVSKLPADIEDRTIPGGLNSQVAIRIVRPKGSTGALPVVMYFHGGGWVLGDTERMTLDPGIAQGANAAVVFVNYSRPPRPAIRWPSRKPTMPPDGCPSMARPST